MTAAVGNGRPPEASDAAAAEERFFDELFGPTRVMVILRGLGAGATIRRAEEAWAHGVRAVEVTVASESDLPSLVAAVDAGHARGVRVGAGSVAQDHQVPAITEIGADFAVSPGVDERVSRACREAGLPLIPGVATPSEIMLAGRLGHTWLKVFPARELGSSWIRAMSGPFPRPRWIATGGMTVGSAPEFLAAGARVLGMGSQIDDWGAASVLLGATPG